MMIRATDEDPATRREMELRYDGPMPPRRSNMQRLQRILGTLDVLLRQADQAKAEGRHEDRERLHEECAELAAEIYEGMI